MSRNSCVGHHADDDVGPEQCQEVVGIEVYLELAVHPTGRKFAHTHNLGIETAMENGIEHRFLSLELGIDVLVGIDVQAEPQILLGEFDIRRRHVIVLSWHQTCRRDNYLFMIYRRPYRIAMMT